MSFSPFLFHLIKDVERERAERGSPSNCSRSPAQTGAAAAAAAGRNFNGSCAGPFSGGRETPRVASPSHNCLPFIGPPIQSVHFGLRSHSSAPALKSRTSKSICFVNKSNRDNNLSRPRLSLLPRHGIRKWPRSSTTRASTPSCTSPCSRPRTAS